jgi:hypothetical protein
VVIAKPPPHLAAVYDENDSSWTMTGDYDQIVNAPDDHVIYVTTVDELREELQARNPTNDPRLSYEVYGYGYTARLSTKLVYNGKDAQELCNTLLENEEVNKHGLHVCNHELQEYLRAHAGDHGLVPSHCYGAWRYDPQVARQRRVRAAYAQRRRGLPLYEVKAAVSALHSTLALHLPLGDPPGGNWHDVVYGFKNRICYFNMLFGKNAHRRHPAFQALLRAWRALGDVGKDRLRNRPYNLASFCNWMDTEAKAKRLKLVEKGHCWKPRNFVYPNF